MGTGRPGITEHTDRHCCCSRTCQGGRPSPKPWDWRFRSLYPQMLPLTPHRSLEEQLRKVSVLSFFFILHAFSGEYVFLSYGESPSIWSGIVFICLLVICLPLWSVNSLFTDVLLILCTRGSPAPSTVQGTEVVLRRLFLTNKWDVLVCPHLHPAAPGGGRPVSAE